MMVGMEKRRKKTQMGTDVWKKADNEIKTRKRLRRSVGKTIGRRGLG